MGGVTESCKFTGNGATNCGRGKFFKAGLPSVVSVSFVLGEQFIH